MYLISTPPGGIEDRFATHISGWSSGCEFFALRVTPPARPRPALAPKWPKIAQRFHQIGTKNRPNMRYPNRNYRPKMGYPIGPWEQHIEKNRFKKATQQKKGRNSTEPLHFCRKSGQHGPKLGSKIDQKSIKNLCKNRSFF